MSLKNKTHIYVFYIKHVHFMDIGHKTYKNISFILISLVTN